MRRMLIIFIINSTALSMHEHISHIQNSIVNREFPLSIQDVVLLVYRHYEVQVTVILWFTLT